MSGSSVGSSSEVKLSVSFATTENNQKRIEELNGTRDEPDIKRTVDKSYDSQGTSPPEAVASPEAYINYASLSPKQQKRTITQIMEKSTGKSTNQGATVKRRRKKIHISTGDWRIIMSAINHDTEVPANSRREVLMGY
jgi:hypothetical protein